MRIVVFGQIGLRKKRFLGDLEALARNNGKSLQVFNVGEMMYASDTTIRQGRILDKKVPELNTIRGRVIDNIASAMSNAPSSDNFIINNHATFRWSNGLFLGFSRPEIEKLQPNLCITLIDNIQDIRLSLSLRGQKPEPFTLKDIIVWREEEILAAELGTAFVEGCKHYVVAKSHGPELIYKLVFESHLPKVYLSYPITLALGHPATWNAIADFRSRLKDLLICFDPFTISESSLITEYRNAKSQRRKRTYVSIPVEDHTLKVNLVEIEQIIANIEGQIVARDFKLIEQADMVVAYIPERDDIPQLSEGVSRELAHAKDCTIERYVIWPSSRAPSPFLQATSVFKGADEFVTFISSRLNG